MDKFDDKILISRDMLENDYVPTYLHNKQIISLFNETREILKNQAIGILNIAKESITLNEFIEKLQKLIDDNYIKEGIQYANKI